jgi:ATP-dependent DNA helicase RecG
MQHVDQVACNNCEPPLTVIQETVKSAASAVVVVINVPKGDQRPYRTSRGVYYVRTTSGRRQASRQELLRLFQAAESLFYDETVVLRVFWLTWIARRLTTLSSKPITARLRTLAWDMSRR